MRYVRALVALTATIAVLGAGSAAAKPPPRYNLTTIPASGTVLKSYVQTVVIAIKYVVPIRHVLLDGKILDRVAVHQWRGRVRLVPGRNEYEIVVLKRHRPRVVQKYVLYAFVNNDFIRDPNRDSGLPSCTVCIWEDTVGDNKGPGDIGALRVTGRPETSGSLVTATVAVAGGYPCLRFVAKGRSGWIGCHGSKIVDARRRPIGHVRTTRVVGEGLTAWIFRFHSRELGSPSRLYLRVVTPLGGPHVADRAPNTVKRAPNLMYEVQLR